MVVPNKESLTYLEVYRPVAETEGCREFLAKVRNIADTIFEPETRAYATQPTIVESESGAEDELVMRTSPIREPSYDLYTNGRLRFALLDQRVRPDLSYSARFRYSAGRLIKDADDRVFRPIQRTPEEEARRRAERERTSLAARFAEAAEAYGVTDLDRVKVKFDGVTTLNDPFLSTGGAIEVSITPQSDSNVTQMLIAHAGICLRSLANISSKAAYPYTPNVLNVPFIRLPYNSTLAKRIEFIGSVKELLPVRLTLENFQDTVHSQAGKVR